MINWLLNIIDSQFFHRLIHLYIFYLVFKKNFIVFLCISLTQPFAIAWLHVHTISIISFLCILYFVFCISFDFEFFLLLFFLRAISYYNLKCINIYYFSIVFAIDIIVLWDFIFFFVWVCYFWNINLEFIARFLLCLWVLSHSEGKYHVKFRISKTMLFE